MAHYAYLNENNVVTQVVVGKDEGDGNVDWEQYYGAKRTSYNTFRGQHSLGGTPFRGNYAGVGMTFLPDVGIDGIFIEPQPFSSWTLDEATASWLPPTPVPTEGRWYWDEPSLSWIALPDPTES